MKGFLYALKGLAEGIKSQLNMKVHIVIAAVILLTGYLLSIEPHEWKWLIICIGFVLATELINTAIEYLVNFISPDYHPLAGKIKDLSAAGVLIAALTALIIGLIIFVPRIMFLLKYYK
jgi:diacylglycerol kinase (ATP)